MTNKTRILRAGRQAAGRCLSRVLHLRLMPLDWDVLKEVTDRLDLSVSEIARRSLRIGLDILGKVEFPGSPS